jgi:hypothetical protein
MDKTLAVSSGIKDFVGGFVGNQVRCIILKRKPTQAKPIQDSRISLIIFSKNYATSKWCLDELLHVIECRKCHGQVVIPVFYNIEPWHVRHQAGSYEEAFAKYEGELMNNESFANTVSQWRIALAEAANIPGWDSQSRTYK